MGIFHTGKKQLEPTMTRETVQTADGMFPTAPSFWSIWLQLQEALQ